MNSEVFKEYFDNEYKPTYFIAEIGSNFDGDINRAYKLIELAKSSGADAVKFQHYTASSLVSDFGFKNLKNKTHQNSWKKSVFETYNDASLKKEWTNLLNLKAKEFEIDFLTSPYSLELVDYVNDYVSCYKIGSGDIDYLEIIQKVSLQNKPVIVGCGASTWADIDNVEEILSKNNTPRAYLQCNTNYTGSDDNFKFINLRVIENMKSRYPNAVIGLSDHTRGHTTVLGAISLGARIVEKHFTDDKTRIGPDHKFAMDPSDWRIMINESRNLEKALGNGFKDIEDNEKETYLVQRRSVRLKKDLVAGHIISREDLEVLRPQELGAVSPNQIQNLIGKKLKINMKAGMVLTFKDL